MLDNAATLFLGKGISDQIDFIDGALASSTPEVEDRVLPEPYPKARIYADQPFTLDDFQIGSVRFSIPPVSVGVERLRDVQTTPIIRGQAIASKASASVVQISLAMDFPDPESIDQELRPLLAELKACPATKLRSYDLALKLTGLSGFELSDELASLQRDILNAEAARSQILGLFYDFISPLQNSNTAAVVHASPWQDEIVRMLTNSISEMMDSSLGKDAGFEADKILDNLRNIIRNNANLIIQSHGKGTLGGLLHRVGIKEPGILDGSAIQEALAEASKDSEVLTDFNERILHLTTAINNLLTAVTSANENEKAAFASDSHLPLMNGFVPVVCQQIVFSSIPDMSGAFRVSFLFEYFYHTNYVSEILYHSYDSQNGVWGASTDPSEADFLIRWRDKQYLDAPPLLHSSENRRLESIVRDLNSRGGDGLGLPGFIKLMERARFQRTCRSFPSDPLDHHLRIFYPRAFPAIQRSVNSVNTNAQYRGVELDTATADTGGIVSSVQVVWNFNIARHIDEHHGVVRHQFTGGTTMNVSFEVCIPTDDLDEVDINRMLNPKVDNAMKGESMYAKTITTLNDMFMVMEQNRKFIPSDAFVPTTIFVDNPITALFGAYCFELNDIPMFQSSPGKVTTVLNFVESLPVLGAMGYETFEDPQKESLGPVHEDKSWLLITTAVRKGLLSNNYLRSLLSDVLPKRTSGLEYFNNYWVEVFRELTALEHGVNASSTNPEFLEAAFLLEEDIKKELSPVPLSQSGYTEWKYDDSRLGLDLIPLILHNYLMGVTFGALPSNDMGSMATRLYTLLVKTTKDPVERVEVFKRVFKLEPPSFNQVWLDILNSGNAVGPDLYDLIKELALPVDTGRDPLTNILESIVREEHDREGVKRVQTEQLYPDMMLPRYHEIFGVDSDVVMEDEDLIQWIPTMQEVGMLDLGQQEAFKPSRSITDIADPDVYFLRETPFIKLAGQLGVDERIDAPTDSTNVETSQSTVDTPDEDRESGSSIQSTFRRISMAISQENTASDLDNAVSHVLVESDITPNNRRLLYMFPTYSMEFFLDIQNTPMGPNGYPVPGTTQHYEARLLNILPLIDLEVYEDARNNPNIANIQFVARRSGLRNNSWKFLPPRNPKTVYRDNKTLQFTNDIELVRQHLDDYSTIKSDPMLLTNTIFTGGTRCVVKLGYGVDVNNPRMLVPKIAGTIGEIALGEISQMVVQSFGTQLANPLNTTIGGSGRYSPNRTLSGAYTMQAFADLFHSLDTRFLGRTGRGVDVDAQSLNDQDLQRIAFLTYQTRTQLGSLARFILGQAQDSEWSAWRFLNAAFLAPKLIREGIELVLGEEGVEDLLTGYLNPYRTFLPELLNVKGPPRGISDWAISNTSTKNLPGTAWIDMISRLNPGTIWYPHTYGDEVRLFWGRPESVFRADPGDLSVDLSNTSLRMVSQLIHTTTDELYKEIRNKVLVSVEEMQALPEVAKYLFKPLSVDGAPIENRTLGESVNYLRSKGLDDEAVGALMRKLMIVMLENRTTIKVDNLNTFTARRTQQLIFQLQNEIVFNERFGGNTSFLNTLIVLNSEATTSTDVLRLLVPSVNESPLTNPVDGKSIPWSNHYYAMLFVTTLNLTRQLDTEVFGTLKLSDLDLDVNSEALSLATRIKRLNGYRRFRNNHYLLTGMNLMSSQVEATQSHMANAVSYDGWVAGYNVLPEEKRVVDLDSEMQKLNFGVFEWFKGLVIKTERDRVVDVLFPSQLARGMSKMYRGELVLIGDPWIKPHDNLHTLDLYNGVYGTLMSETVINKLSVQTGLVTIVRPALLTDAQESSFLTDTIVPRRVLKSTAVALVVVGTGAALLGGVPGLIIGTGLGLAAAGVGTFGAVLEMYGRLSLSSVPVTDPLQQFFVNHSRTRESLNAGDGESALLNAEDLVTKVMMDVMVSGTSIQATGASGERNRIMERLRAAAEDRDHSLAANLGVSIFPLIRMGSQTPVLAGLRTRSFETIPMPAFTDLALYANFDITYRLRTGVSDLILIYDQSFLDFHSGLNYIRDSVRAKRAEMERLERVFKQRGLILRQDLTE